MACLIFLTLIFNNIKEFSDYFTFQQDSAPAHLAKETVELLKRETPDFIPPSLWPSNSPDLNPVNGNTEIAGLDIDGRMCGQLTELKLQNFIL